MQPDIVPYSSCNCPLQEVFVSEVEVLRAELYETDVTVEGEFLSDEQMEAEKISPYPGWNVVYVKYVVHANI